MPPSPGNEGLWGECPHGRADTLVEGPLGVPWGRKYPLHLLYFVFLTLSSGLHETLALLTSQLRPDSNHKDEMGFLRDVFSEKSLSYLMKVKPQFISPW